MSAARGTHSRRYDARRAADSLATDIRDFRRRWAHAQEHDPEYYKDYENKQRAFEDESYEIGGAACDVLLRLSDEGII